MRGVDLQFAATTDSQPRSCTSSTSTRGCPGGLVEQSVTADVFIDELDRIGATRGYPAVLRCGTALARDVMADSAGERVGSFNLQPGRRRNGYVESFNVRVPDECLDNQSVLVTALRS